MTTFTFNFYLKTRSVPEHMNAWLKKLTEQKLSPQIELLVVCQGSVYDGKAGGDRAGARTIYPTFDWWSAKKECQINHKTKRRSEGLWLYCYLWIYIYKRRIQRIVFFRKNRQLISNLMVTWRCIKLISWTRVLEDIVRKGVWPWMFNSQGLVKEINVGPVVVPKRIGITH